MGNTQAQVLDLGSECANGEWAVFIPAKKAVSEQVLLIVWYIHQKNAKNNSLL